MRDLPPTPLMIIDISGELPPLPPCWLVAVPPGTDVCGLQALEAAVVRDLSIIPAESCVPGQVFYSSETDCAAVALEMSKRRPDVEFWVSAG